MTLDDLLHIEVTPSGDVLLDIINEWAWEFADDPDLTITDIRRRLTMALTPDKQTTE